MKGLSQAWPEVWTTRSNTRLSEGIKPAAAQCSTLIRVIMTTQGHVFFGSKAQVIK